MPARFFAAGDACPTDSDMKTSRVSVESWLNLFALNLLFFMFVVLILYMAITPILPFEAYVDVPESKIAKPSPGYENDFTISMPIAGLIIVDNLAVPNRMLEERLASARRNQADVRIRAGRRVPFGDVRRVVQAAQRAGITRITIVARAPKVTPLEQQFAMEWTCPPRYRDMAIALLLAVIPFSGAVAIPLLSRRSRLGCAGWLLLTLAATALVMAWDAARPNCVWY
jgi:biopolymer transport protein ExbD